jgi:hypothetical protein
MWGLVGVRAESCWALTCSYWMHLTTSLYEINLTLLTSCDVLNPSKKWSMGRRASMVARCATSAWSMAIWVDSETSMAHPVWRVAITSCVRMCVYEYVCVCIHLCMCVYIYIYIYMYIHVTMYVCMYTCMHTYRMLQCSCACIQKYLHKGLHVRTDHGAMYLCGYYIHAHTYTHTFTHGILM